MRESVVVTPLIIIVFALLAFASPAYPEVNVAAVRADATPRAEVTKAARDQALKHKKLGDDFRYRNEIPSAAEEYIKALSLYDGFSIEDRFMMAQYISWSGKLDEAISLLEQILLEEPGHLKARIQLAKCHLWKGNLSVALEESSRALEASPGDKDVLLVRANLFRLMGEIDASISIYRDILENSEDFDARLGLSTAYLAAGNLPGAIEQAQQLVPRYPHHERELAALQVELDNAALANAAPEKGAETAASDLVADSAEAAGTPREKAMWHVRSGDLLRQGNDNRGAADEYVKALSLYDGFTTAELFMFSQYLSWGGQLDEAIRVLEKILSEEPDNLKARIHLARCHSWNGNQSAALTEANKALAASPGNKDALLVRANALRWSGNPNAAVYIYKDILATQEDFDTRMALSQAYLYDGYLRGAREGAELLQPAYPYQERQVQELRKEIRIASRPDAGAGYSYYSDTEHNRVHRYNAYAGLWTGYVKWRLGYHYTDATNQSLSASSHEITLSADSRPLEWLWVGGTIGYNIASNGSSDSVVIGGVRAGTKFFDGKINARLHRGAMNYTAAVLDNRIRFTEYAVDVIYPLPYRFSVFAGYTGRDYSDDNGSTDLRLMVRHAFGWANPFVSVGYEVRYLNFKRESGGGYFDPSNFVSNKADVAINYTWGKMYSHLGLFGGYQFYNRYGNSHDAFFYGGHFVLGSRITNSIACEIHGETSDEAGGTVVGTGFRYYLVGARVRVVF